MTDVGGTPFPADQRRRDLPIALYVRPFTNGGLDYAQAVREVADEFDALAAAEKDERLKRRYADVAECFRLLAKERARLIGDGDLAPDTQPRAH